jgi:hypothetical protein
MSGMTPGIVHHQRLAWDCARAFVAAVDHDSQYLWLRREVNRLLGPQYEHAMSDSRDRLSTATRPDAPQAEAGLWRARIEDVLRERPDLALVLADLAEEARRRVDGLYPIG